FWQVRRSALNALAEDTAEHRTAVIFAADDPHWRVRYALAQVLEESGRAPGSRHDILEALGPYPYIGHPRAERIGDYLRYRRTGELPPERPGVDPQSWCPFWDWDAAVLARNIELLGRAGRHAALDELVRLVNHPDERVRGWVIQALREDGNAEQW